jgi:hypothetical protein
LTKKYEEKIETAEIKFLRSVAGSTRKDQTRNTEIGRCRTSLIKMMKF